MAGLLTEAHILHREIRNQYLYITYNSDSLYFSNGSAMSPRRPGFDPSLVYVIFVIYIVALEKISLLTSAYQCHSTNDPHPYSS